MKKEEAEVYLNKNVRIILKNGFSYHGKVLKVNENSLILKDKYGSDVFIDLSNISLMSNIQTVKGDNIAS